MSLQLTELGKSLKKKGGKVCICSCRIFAVDGAWGPRSCMFLPTCKWRYQLDHLNDADNISEKQKYGGLGSGTKGPSEPACSHGLVQLPRRGEVQQASIGARVYRR